MLKAAVKFCGGCNPRYDRGEMYNAFREKLKDSVQFELPQPDTHYDFLLVIMGCHACNYTYEEIDAAHRFYCIAYADFEPILRQIGELITPIREEMTR